MKRIASFTGILAIALVAGCSRGSAPADESLDHELELAASDGLTLAPVSSSLDFSAAEISPPKATTVTRSAARHHENTPKQQTTVPDAISVEASDVVAITSAPAPVEDPAGEIATVEVPAPVHRPAPIPADLPAGSSAGGDGGDIGTAIGTVVGVIIRGGIAGDDHCDPRGRHGGVRIGGRGGVGVPVPIGRTNGGVFINRRLPVSGTFARPR